MPKKPSDYLIVKLAAHRPKCVTPQPVCPQELTGPNTFEVVEEEVVVLVVSHLLRLTTSDRVIQAIRVL